MGHLAMSKYIFGLHNLIGGRDVVMTLASYIETRDAGKHHIINRTASNLTLHQRITWHKVSIVLRLRCLGLQEWIPKMISFLIGT